MPVDVYAETTAFRGGWPAIGPSVLEGAGSDRTRSIGGGSGKCANPLGYRYGRYFGYAVAGAVALAESAETPTTNPTEV
jgi:hypothetical protein